jgi:hypothetical protein
VQLWKEDSYVWYLECVIQWDCYSSCAKIRFQETASGDCNRLRTLVRVSDLYTVITCHVLTLSINPRSNPNTLSISPLNHDNIVLLITQYLGTWNSYCSSVKVSACDSYFECPFLLWESNKIYAKRKKRQNKCDTLMTPPHFYAGNRDSLRIYIFPITWTSKG